GPAQAKPLHLRFERGASAVVRPGQQQHGVGATSQHQRERIDEKVEALDRVEPPQKADDGLPRRDVEAALERIHVGGQVGGGNVDAVRDAERAVCGQAQRKELPLLHLGERVQAARPLQKGPPPQRIVQSLVGGAAQFGGQAAVRRDDRRCASAAQGGQCGGVEQAPRLVDVNYIGGGHELRGGPAKSARQEHAPPGERV